MSLKVKHKTTYLYNTVSFFIRFHDTWQELRTACIVICLPAVLPHCQMHCINPQQTSWLNVLHLGRGNINILHGTIQNNTGCEGCLDCVLQVSRGTVWNLWVDNLLLSLLPSYFITSCYHNKSQVWYSGCVSA